MARGKKTVNDERHIVGCELLFGLCTQEEGARRIRRAQRRANESLTRSAERIMFEGDAEPADPVDVDPAPSDDRLFGEW
jgi:hypothetical protein